MSDFASAAMVRILGAGMQRLGLHVPAMSINGAHVSLADKRRLVQAAAAQGGWAALLQLGQGVQAIRGDPVHQALAASRSPAALLARWGRLERYIHSRHRLDVRESSAGLEVTHLSLRADETPLPHENLVVLGVLAAALGEAGVYGLRVFMAGTPVLPHPQEATLQALVASGQTSHWRLQWDGQTLPLARAGAHPEPTIAPVLAAPAPAQALGQLLLEDLMDAPPLAQAARQLGLAPRSLQRELATHGLSYTGIVAQTRCHAAAWYLVHTGLATAETGFVCGYSDQAHFTRQFSRRVGVTPGAYRREFAAVAVSSGGV